LRRDDSGTVYVRDVAQAQIGRKFQDSVFLLNGNPSAAIGVIRRGGIKNPPYPKVYKPLARLQKQFDQEGQGLL